MSRGIPDPIVEQVRDRSDIVALVGESVSLRRSGSSFKGLCPFHGERTPSFHVRPGKGYRCFGCGESGDVFTWVMQRRGVGFLDAVRILAGQAGIAVPGDDGAPEYDPAANREAMRRHREALRQRRQAERREQAAAIDRAALFWGACHELRDGHPYLEAKGLDMRGARGLRVDGDGWLVVPARDRHGRLVSYQRISPDGRKLYAAGAPMRDATYVLERYQPSLQVVCEGLATGMAIYNAAEHSRVTLAFSAGGMANAVQRLGPGLCVIASDNDHRTVCPECRSEGLTVARDPRGGVPEACRCNPGIRAALSATQALGLDVKAIAVPVCPDGGTDWQDWRAETLAARLAAWTRKPHETEAKIRRAVDAELAMHLARAAQFRAPKMTA